MFGFLKRICAEFTNLKRLTNFVDAKFLMQRVSEKIAICRGLEEIVDNTNWYHTSKRLSVILTGLLGCYNSRVAHDIHSLTKSLHILIGSICNRNQVKVLNCVSAKCTTFSFLYGAF